MEDQDKVTKLRRANILTHGTFDPKTYQYDSSFRPWDGNDPLGVHTTVEMLECLKKNPKIELDAKVIHVRESDGKLIGQSKQISKQKFVEAYVKDAGAGVTIREGDFGGGVGSTQVGHDFIPLVGGPFYKNLYFYQDYIRMHSEAFFAYHNDPIAHAFVQITRDFVVGTGYEMQCDTSTPVGKVAMAAWKAFEQANDLQQQIDDVVTEISIYGEIMLWCLPNNNAKITYKLTPQDTRPLAAIPRVRLIDPSNIVEIVTYPEDITRPLFYVWLQPTQYQIYTGGAGSDNQSVPTPVQPTLKFIYRQIPAEQVYHFRVNAVSNEKRGRSDFFPVFNYLKRLRDSIDYAMISLEKVSAWSLDTTVKGDQTDIDAYVQAQAAMGTIPPAGSEFVHNEGVVRNYLGNQHASAHSSDVFNWCLSMACAGVGVPVSYIGTHLSGSGNRASALVSTEPVAKKMEKRREVIKRILVKLWNYCMAEGGFPMLDCNVVFPELISQDRSQKLKDLLLMEQARWIKPERAASIAAKEMGIQNFSYEEELKDIEVQLPEIPMPLSDPSQLQPPDSMDPTLNAPKPTGGPGEEGPGPSGMTGNDKQGVKSALATL